MRSKRWTWAAVGLFASAGAVNAQIFKDDLDAYSGTYLGASSGGVWVADGCRDGKLSKISDYTDPDADLGRGVSDYKDGVTNLRTGFRNRHYLTAAELLNAGLVEGSNPNSVNGTDANPLVLDFYLYLGTWTSTTAHPYYRMNNYVELACGTDRAPTPMLTSTCSNTLPYHHLNLLGDGLMHKSIAVGQVAMADTDPCDDASNLYQRNFRLSVYDGMQWHFFTSDELHTCAGFNWVELTVTTNTIQIRIHNRFSTDTGQCNRSNAWNTRSKILPRRYPGQFTSIALGGLTNEENGECWGEHNDYGYPSQESGIDAIELNGGVASYVAGACEDTGACCKADWSCEQLTPTACQAANGTFKGLGTLCGVGVGRCCADPVVDGDHDTDVDMVDFAKLQRCVTLTGTISPECTCFDTNEDGTINITDVEQFALCASGAGVPADISCDDAF